MRKRRSSDLKMVPAQTAPRPLLSHDFPTTRWSVVLDARDTDLATARSALEILYQSYWPPLYGFVRRRGNSVEESRDLLQAFFTHLLEGNCLQAVSEEQGLFRAFMLACLKNFLAGERRYQAALKRGAGRGEISLDISTAERHLQLEPRDDTTPEDLFERGWALIILKCALERLRGQQQESGDSRRFELLQGYLIGDQPSLPYRDVAVELGISEDALRQAVRRFRQSFGRCLRAEIAETVARPSDVDNEVRYLLQVLRD